MAETFKKQDENVADLISVPTSSFISTKPSVSKSFSIDSEKSAFKEPQDYILSYLLQRKTKEFDTASPRSYGSVNISQFYEVESESPDLKSRSFSRNYQKFTSKNDISEIRELTKIDSFDSTVETNNNIANIAKQISDHAEIIYQYWKASGLSPKEILNIKNIDNSDNYLQNSFEVSIKQLLSSSPNMSNNNLKQLVNSFVNEDKARQIKINKRDNLTPESEFSESNGEKDEYGAKNNKYGLSKIKSSAIRETLQKFESINCANAVSDARISFSKTQNSANSNIIKQNSYPDKAPIKNKLFLQQESNKSVDEKYTDDKIVQSQLSKISIEKITPSPSNKPKKPVKPESLIKFVTENRQSNEALSLAPSMIKTNNQNENLSKFYNKKYSPSQIQNSSNFENEINVKTQSGFEKQAISESEKHTSDENKIFQSELTNKSKFTIEKQKNYLPFGKNSEQLECFSVSTLNPEKENKVFKNTVLSKETVNFEKKGKENLDLKIDKTENEMVHKLSAHQQHENKIKQTNINLCSTSKENENKTKIENSRKLSKKGLVEDTTDNISDLKLRRDFVKSIPVSKQQFSASNSSGEGSRCEKNLENKTVKTSMDIMPSLKSATNLTGISKQSTITSINNSNVNNTINSTTIAPKLGSNFRMKIRQKTDGSPGNTFSSESKTSVLKGPNFLTRGSVAERIMMFEKCPDIVMSPFRHVRDKEPQVKPKLHAVHSSMVPKPETQSQTTLQRAVRGSNAKNLYIPRFYYPHGKPLPNIAQETIIQQIKAAFDAFPNNQCPKQEFHKILKLCNLPLYWRMPFISCSQIMAGSVVDGYRFVDFWKQMSVYCHDLESKFVYILSRGQRSRPYILPEDFIPLVQDVVDTHPGLAFLKEASEFHSRYIHTVISRIYYTVNRSWTNRITVSELKRSNLLQVIQLLEEEEDINQIMAYFSYEHFYVIYCKFWELDRDHDLFIDQNDLAQHNNHALSSRIIERIFSGCVMRGEKYSLGGTIESKMSYADFVWFLLSEEDKTTPTAIEYWFRCMDLDGDGILSMYELEYFYEEQQERMFSLGIETLPFEDCLCQMLDMIKPKKIGCITLSDLKRCKLTPVFFDTFFNLVKYLDYEQRDPFASQKECDDMTDWERYAAQEYELLVAEENDVQGCYEDDIEEESQYNIINGISSRQNI